jgi:acyl-CoA synthetase (AMP-forming)/AMP-acid ligase II
MNLPELTLPQMLRERAKSDAARLAIRQKDFGIWKPFTWADYHRRASAFGLGLAALGVPTGGHVGVLSENRIEWVLAQMGAGLIGAVTVGVYPTSPAAKWPMWLATPTFPSWSAKTRSRPTSCSKRGPTCRYCARSSSWKPRACAASRPKSAR